MSTYEGPLDVQPATDFTAEVVQLAYDSQRLTLVLDGKEFSQNEPNWQIDCTLPWQGSVYRGPAKLVYEPDEQGRETYEPSPAVVAVRVTGAAEGIGVEMMIFQADGDSGADDKWRLTGILSRECAGGSGG